MWEGAGPVPSGRGVRGQCVARRLGNSTRRSIGKGRDLFFFLPPRLFTLAPEASIFPAMLRRARGDGFPLHSPGIACSNVT